MPSLNPHTKKDTLDLSHPRREPRIIPAEGSRIRKKGGPVLRHDPLGLRKNFPCRNAKKEQWYSPYNPLRSAIPNHSRQIVVPVDKIRRFLPVHRTGKTGGEQIAPTEQLEREEDPCPRD